MQIISISWVRNEADIIETFVRHHARFFDRLIIIDNASTDATREILRNLHEEGLPIEIRHDESIVHRQGEALTALMHDVSLSDDPDWIIPLDADEFVTGSDDLRSVIADLPGNHVSLIPWKTYVPTVDDDLGEESIAKRITHRRSMESPQYHKILIPRAFHAMPYSILLGSHALESAAGPVPMRAIDGLCLAHFPVRSPTQIRRKIVESWERHTADPNRQVGQNYHWEQLYQEMLAGPPSLKRLEEIALRYAMIDPIPIDPVYDPIIL